MASHIASIFLYSWVIPYCIPKYVQTDNGQQFLGNIFTDLCRYLFVKNLETTEWNPQTNGHTKRYNNTIVARMSRYVDENQTDRETNVKLVTYGYNTQVHHSKNFTAFSLVLSRQPHGPTTTEYLTALPNDLTKDFPADKMRILLQIRLCLMIRKVERNVTM